MEKLLKLLNEYRTEKGERNLNEFEVSQTLDSLNYLRLFIKWLVEQDKIDFYEWKYLENPIWSNNYDGCDYLELIQWLAISDTPIEDLIYYLK